MGFSMDIGPSNQSQPLHSISEGLGVSMNVLRGVVNPVNPCPAQRSWTGTEPSLGAQVGF